jgi:hypothetical protein
MVGHLEDLHEIWDTLYSCYERPEKYMDEALKPILEFRMYKVYDNSAIREFLFSTQGLYKGSESYWAGGLTCEQPDGSKDHGKNAIHGLEGLGHKKA